MEIISVARGVFFAGAILMTASQAGAASFVTNGSFEDGAFVNQSFNYMRVPAGNSAITGWTVSSGPVAWGVNPQDGLQAADGVGLIDLSGFSAEAPTGTIQQALATTPGELYTFSFAFSGSLSQVSIGSLTLSLTLGSSFNVGSTVWTLASADFIAPAGVQLLSIANVTPTALLVLIDNVNVTSQDDVSSTPVPGALPLFGSVLAGGALLHWRRRKKVA